MADDDAVKKVAAWLGVVGGVIGVLAFFGITNFNQLKHAVATPSSPPGSTSMTTAFTYMPPAAPTTTDPVPGACQRFQDLTEPSLPTGELISTAQQEIWNYVDKVDNIAGTVGGHQLGVDLTRFAGDWIRQAGELGPSQTAAFAADSDQATRDYSLILTDCS